MLKTEIGNLTDAIAQGVLRSSRAIPEKLRAAEEELAGLEAQPVRPMAVIARAGGNIASNSGSGGRISLPAILVRFSLAA